MYLIFTMLESTDESNPFVGISCCLCYKLWNFYEAFPPLIYGECYQTLPLLAAAAAPHLKSSNFQEPKPLMWERIKYDDRFRKVFTKFSIRILFSKKKHLKAFYLVKVEAQDKKWKKCGKFVKVAQFCEPDQSCARGGGWRAGHGEGERSNILVNVIRFRSGLIGLQHHVHTMHWCRYAERFQTQVGVTRIKIWNNYNKLLGTSINI